jgi:capsular polysaccharide transport system permease protein
MTSQPPTAAPQIAPAQRPRGRSHRFATLRTITALVLREMSTRYGRTPGGYIWSILEPLAAILFLSIGFSLMIRSPSLGTSFLLFYATGFLPFNLYQTISNTTARALNFSKPLLKYPAVTWVDAIFARFILNCLTGLLVSFLLIGSMLLIADSHAVVDMGITLQALGLVMVLGLGVGTLNCVLLGLYPLWDVAWSVITRPLFLASGVLYIFEDLPPLARDVLWYNPLLHITGLMRSGFYPTYTASYVSILYVLLISLILLVLGLILMGRYHRVILNR